jgi:hypothetical protein
MDLNDVFSNIADQDRGRLLEVVDPWTGEPAGIRFRIAGPDSEVQHRARIEMMDELADAADTEGKSVAMSHKNVLRVLRAGTWIQAQVDAFAGDRRNFAPEA